MKIKLIQKLIDFIRFKYLKNYLNENPIALRFLINLCSLFPQGGNNLKIKLLRYCGAKIGKNVGISDNIYLFRPKNLQLYDFSSIPDNTILQCWNKIHISKYSFPATGCVFVSGSHRTDNYENLENQEILIGKGCWIGTNCTILGGVNLGNGSIVGAGTVLLGKNYPPFSIIAGISGKILKKRKPSKIINIPATYNIEELNDA